MPKPASLPWTEQEDANRLLAEDPLALMLGMMLDQQFPMERAFLGPFLLRERLGRDLDAADIAGIDPDALAEVFRGPPAIHRFPGSMAKRAQALCAFVVERYEGDVARIWTDADATEVLKRLQELPGYGKEKSRIFVAILGKRMGIRPAGWEKQAADWPSIADVATWDDIFVLREKKRLAKGAKK
ncbi:MAG: Fe-S cluster assembly protein HesB [Acidimicrobiia bacterium]|nr:Fe-S cluster assembly protein HesB [Acidimicrobiia bacterium]MDH3397764.1 Fe-S cluster assembly protein HesB [Acidimicrobiia bacterium]MDH5615517.1 Fe-S cluster assembly protein HesB [Acidimicrobiia bacterium]